MKVLAFVLSFFITTVYAEEITVDYNNCYNGDLPITLENETTTTFNWQTTGIITSSNEMYKNATTNCIGMTWNLVDKKDMSNAKRHGFCIIKLSDGHYMIELAHENVEEGMTWKVVDGEGKFDGVTGNGKLTFHAFSFPGPRGGSTFLGCSNTTGTLTLK